MGVGFRDEAVDGDFEIVDGAEHSALETPSGEFGKEAFNRRNGHAPGRFYSALTDCTLQLVGILPTLPVEATAVPFMNHTEVLPLPSRQSRSLIPSPL